MMGDIAERLRVALAIRHLKMSDLSASFSRVNDARRACGQPPLWGTNYTAVVRHCGGSSRGHHKSHAQTTPSMAVIEEYARILGVRVAWLAFGDGPMEAGP